MAADMIKTVMQAEAQGRALETQAANAAEKIINDARIQADIIIKTSVDQAHSQANIIISDAEYSANGTILQAEKLAELREKKSITDTEKKYDFAIKMVFVELIK